MLISGVHSFAVREGQLANGPGHVWQMSVFSYQNKSRFILPSALSPRGVFDQRKQDKGAIVYSQKPVISSLGKPNFRLLLRAAGPHPLGPRGEGPFLEFVLSLLSPHVYQLYTRTEREGEREYSAQDPRIFGTHGERQVIVRCTAEREENLHPKSSGLTKTLT